jgi:hypothetical protein
MDTLTPRIAPPEPSRRLIVASRILLLLAALGASGAAAFIGLRDRESVESGVRYVCPMHPEVRAGSQGQCPICHMALTPLNREAPRAQALADTTAVDNVRKHRIMDFVRKRSLLFPVQELRAPASVDEDGAVTAVFYDDQIAVIAAGEEGSFSPTDSPSTSFSLRRTVDAPVRWDPSTSRIRFASASAALRPGQIGWLTLPRKSREVLTVPASAIVNSAEGPYVLAAAANGGFEKRSIEIGETFVKQGFAVVLSGLEVHERIVSRATFFLDADRRLGLTFGEEGDAP